MESHNQSLGETRISNHFHGTLLQQICSVGTRWAGCLVVNAVPLKELLEPFGNVTQALVTPNEK